MARRRGFLHGSVLLGLIIVNSLAAPATATGGLCESAVIVHGYKCHEFEVTTDDGYILGLQRIPEGRSRGGASDVVKKRPVILQHGVLADGTMWLLNPAEQDLPFILADNGFDVWIANARGTSFSRKHVTLDSSSRKYWDWTWDEMVTHDLPAIFDFVFTQTHQKIDYVGHSLGTLVMLASLSEGKLLDKVRSAALLSPIAYLSHITTALGNLAARFLVGELIYLLGVEEFNPGGLAVTKFIINLCTKPGMDCSDLITAIAGKNCCLNSSTVNLLLKHGSQSTSTKNVVHLAQTVRHGGLAKYDYGSLLLNMLHYGMARPPTYDLANIPRDFPLFMSYGGRDPLSDPRDVQDLLDVIEQHDEDKLLVQFVEQYAHVDFIMAINAKGLVYNSVLSFFEDH